MKINKLFVAALAALTFAACSSDKGETPDPGVVEGQPTYMALQVSQKLPVTYAPISPEAPIVGETEYSGDVFVAVFNSSNNLEAFETVPFASIVANKTTKFQVTTGQKYVYVVLNKPSTLTLPSALGTTTRSAFETTLYALAANDEAAAELAQSTKFFMTNVKAPAAATLVAGVTDPVLESKNVIKVQVGRVVAKVSVLFDAPVSQQLGGTLSNIDFKVGSYALSTYTVGQWTGTQMTSPLFSAAFLAANYSKEKVALYTAAQDNINSITTDTPKYVLENSNSTPLEGNTTRVIVRAKFTPTQWWDPTTAAASSTPGAGGNIWFVTNGTYNYYCNVDPTTTAWYGGLGAGYTTTLYTGGICYYNKVWVMDPQESGSEKYCVIRNYSYRVKLTSVNGIGTNIEDGNITITDPIETNTQMVAEIEVLPWSLVEINTGLDE